MLCNTLLTLQIQFPYCLQKQDKRHPEVLKRRSRTLSVSNSIKLQNMFKGLEGSMNAKYCFYANRFNSYVPRESCQWQSSYVKEKIVDNALDGHDTTALNQKKCPKGDPGRQDSILPIQVQIFHDNSINDTVLANSQILHPESERNSTNGTQIKQVFKKVTFEGRNL